MEWSDPGVLAGLGAGLTAFGTAVGVAGKTLSDHLSGIKAERSQQREIAATENHEKFTAEQEVSKNQRDRILFLEKTLNDTMTRNSEAIDKLRDREDECQKRQTELAIKLAELMGEHNRLLDKFHTLEKQVMEQASQRVVDRQERDMISLHTLVVDGGNKADAAYKEASKIVQAGQLTDQQTKSVKE